MHHQTRRSIEIRLEEAVTGTLPHDEAGTVVTERSAADAALHAPLEPPKVTRPPDEVLPAPLTVAAMADSRSAPPVHS